MQKMMKPVVIVMIMGMERGIEPFIAPWGPFETKDGWIALIVPTERDWSRFCEAMGRSDLVGMEGETDSGPVRAKNMRARPSSEFSGVKWLSLEKAKDMRVGRKAEWLIKRR